MPDDGSASRDRIVGGRTDFLALEPARAGLPCDKHNLAEGRIFGVRREVRADEER
jgi:hypothetical protein